MDQDSGLLMFIFMLILVIIGLIIFFIVLPAISLMDSFKKMQTAATNTQNLISCFGGNVYLAIQDVCNTACATSCTCGGYDFCRSIVPKCAAGAPALDICGFSSLASLI